MADMFQEGWMKGVAVTTTCLAVMTAIAASRGTSCINKTQLLTTKAGSQWAYYQAKSIKQNLAETQKNAFEVEILGASNDQQRALYQAKLDTVAQEVHRYAKEKDEIKSAAEAFEHQNDLLSKKGMFFLASVVFFQVAIMLSSVAALLKKRYMWILGLVFGVIATALLGYGLFLEPLLF